MNKKNPAEKKSVVRLLLMASLAVLLFGSGFKLGELRVAQGMLERPSYNILNSQTPQNIKNVDFSLFWDAWNKVEQKFIDQKKLDPKTMMFGAIKGMVSSLNDPYTFFLTPDENKQSKDDLGGKFQGIGAQLGLAENRIVIVAPLKNSPAMKAGVLAGDFINKVDGQSTKGWTLTQAVSKIRGNKGTKVTLTLERKNKDFDVTIVRDDIKVSSVELEFTAKKDCPGCANIAYLKLNQFGETTNDEWDNAVEQISAKWKTKQIKGMVLDLRDNPGGYLESAVYLSSEFLPEGKVVVKQESTVTETRDYNVDRTGKLLDIPLVVLINQGSASAAEILSGALRDYKRAKLVGNKSFGKGSVQEALDLSSGAGLHVTVAHWILPKGDWINGKGIEPDIKVDNQLKEGNTLTRDNDSQLEKAFELVLQ